MLEHAVRHESGSTVELSNGCILHVRLGNMLQNIPKASTTPALTTRMHPPPVTQRSAPSRIQDSYFFIIVHILVRLNLHDGRVVSLISTPRIFHKENPLLPPPEQPTLTKASDARDLLVGFCGVHTLEGADAVVVVPASGDGDVENGVED